MKKTLFMGIALLSVGFAFMSCSHDTVSNENYVEKKRDAEYQQAFNKAFGTIASGHKWGFDQTTGFTFTTRTAVTSTSEVWIIPETFGGGGQNSEGNNANAIADEFAALETLSKDITGIDFNNYWLQHVEMPKNVKSEIDCLEAYNSKEGKWEKVTNFEKGKNESDFRLNIEDTYAYTGLYRSSKGTTLMTDMGGSADNGNMFRVKMKKGGYNYNYGFLKTTFYDKILKKNVVEAFLGFKLEKKNGKGYSFWVIRVAGAEKYTPTTPNPVVAEGRVLCEDMGANDFDFNDVVFDAWIMNTGEIKIKVLAHGGVLPIAVAGVDVKLGKMTNTGLAEADYQEFTISADDAKTNGWTSIDAIPVTVNPNGDASNSYNLEAKVGSAPQKVCVPINTEWPDEYVIISKAYVPFDEWVSTTDPDLWTETVVSRFTDLDLSNNADDWTEPDDED